MIVVDASVMAAALLRTADAPDLIDRLFADGASLHAPHLIDLELASVMRKLTAGGLIGAARADKALRNLQDVDLTRHAHTQLLPRVWALRDNLTPYDAAYVALAELLDAPLLTRDRRIAAAPGHGARVEVV